MTHLKTNLEGKIRHLPSFRAEALLPLFEAVVNSIQGIEERGDLRRGSVEVRIHREAQRLLADFDTPAITGFSITDNGIGLDDVNLDSFETSDSIHKLAKGGKGVGRFLWLKAFDAVDIESIYQGTEGRLRRLVTFTARAGVVAQPPQPTTDEQRTTVHLRGFREEYRQLPSAYKTTAKIAQRVLEHCLSYFIANAAPTISVADTEGRLVLNDVFDNTIKKYISQEELLIDKLPFSLAHVKLYATHDKMHNIVLCANRRDVKSVSLAKTLGTTSQFDDAGHKFTYALYVTSPRPRQRGG